MATILTPLHKGKESTSVLPIEFNLASSLQGEASFAVDKIIVQTSRHLKKEGGKFYIDSEEIALDTLNVLDLLIILREKGINVGFINNNDYWYYPALCILDFSNVEQHEVKKTQTPFNISPYNQIKSLSVTPLEQTILTVMNVFNINTGQIIPYTQSGNLVSSGKFFENNSIIIMTKVTTNKFMLKLDNKFTTEKIDTVSRYLEGNLSDD